MEKDLSLDKEDRKIQVYAIREIFRLEVFIKIGITFEQLFQRKPSHNFPFKHLVPGLDAWTVHAVNRALELAPSMKTTPPSMFDRPTPTPTPSSIMNGGHQEHYNNNGRHSSSGNNAGGDHYEPSSFAPLPPGHFDGGGGYGGGGGGGGAPNISRHSYNNIGGHHVNTQSQSTPPSSAPRHPGYYPQASLHNLAQQQQHQQHWCGQPGGHQSTQPMRVQPIYDEQRQQSNPSNDYQQQHRQQPPLQSNASFMSTNSAMSYEQHQPPYYDQGGQQQHGPYYTQAGRQQHHQPPLINNHLTPTFPANQSCDDSPYPQDVFSRFGNLDVGIGKPPPAPVPTAAGSHSCRSTPRSSGPATHDTNNSASCAGRPPPTPPKSRSSVPPPRSKRRRFSNENSSSINDSKIMKLDLNSVQDLFEYLRENKEVLSVVELWSADQFIEYLKSSLFSTHKSFHSTLAQAAAFYESIDAFEAKLKPLQDDIDHVVGYTSRRVDEAKLAYESELEQHNKAVERQRIINGVADETANAKKRASVTKQLTSVCRQTSTDGAFCRSGDLIRGLVKDPLDQHWLEDHFKKCGFSPPGGVSPVGLQVAVSSGATVTSSVSDPTYQNVELVRPSDDTAMLNGANERKVADAYNANAKMVPPPTHETAESDNGSTTPSGNMSTAVKSNSSSLYVRRLPINGEEEEDENTAGNIGKKD